MKDPRLADRPTMPMEGGLKRLAKVPRSAVVLLCLCVLGAGIVMGVPSLLFALGDETARRVVLVFLADLNGDEHQDAFLVTNQMHRLVLNDGTGNFTSNQELFMRNYALAMGDLDGNGSLDAILVNFEEGEMGGDLIPECAEMPPDVVFPASLEDAPNQVFAIRDGNSDGLPEGFIAGCCGGGTMMMNYATLFSNRRSCLGIEPPTVAALGDLNGDGTLDVFLAKSRTHTQGDMLNEVWFNDGMGNFTDSGQRLGSAENYAVALGDLNSDGFLDAAVGNRGGGRIWFNDGQGNFTEGKQRLGIARTHTVFVSDVDRDGDLDVFLAGGTSIRVWLNDGAGRFKAGQRINFDRYDAFAVGDVTGDSISDVFVGGPDSYQVWRGDGDGRFSANNRSTYR